MAGVVFDIETDIPRCVLHTADGSLDGDVGMTFDMERTSRVSVVITEDEFVGGGDGQIAVDVIGAINIPRHAAVADLDEVAQMEGRAVARTGPLGKGGGKAQKEDGKEEQFFHGGEVFWANIGKMRNVNCGMRTFFENYYGNEKSFLFLQTN